jgi:hypothetical protein
MTAGRPTKYKEEYCGIAKNYALLGATDKELAVFFGVSEATINNWKLDYPEFLESITEGKEKADAMVAERLFERAMGYTHPEEKIFNNQGEIVRAKTVKHYPPDTKAATFWLKNRQKEKWSDRQKIEHTGADGGAIEYSDIERSKRLDAILDAARERRDRQDTE